MGNILYKNANIFNKDAELGFIQGDMIVSDGKIIEICEPNSQVESDYETVVVCTGKYLIPGLFDCHIHLYLEPFTWDRQKMYENSDEVLMETAEKNAYEMLANGVTFFRDCGGYKGLEFKTAEKFENMPVGTVPDFLLAGSAICVTGGHSWWMNKECDGADGFIKGVREVIKEGSDFIKVMLTGGFARKKMAVSHVAPNCPAQMSLTEAIATVEEAHRREYKVAAHCVGKGGLKVAAEAGIDSVEHGQFFDTSDAEIPEILAKMKSKGMTLVPTMAAYYKNYVKEEIRDEYKYVDESLKLYYEAGVKIALGTDAGCPFVGYDQARIELIHMVEGGMSCKDAIVAATNNSAELLGVESMYGNLTENMIADILVLKENPMENIYCIKDIESVYKKGVLVQK